MTKSLVVVGSVNLDLVVDTDHLPRPGETVSGIDFAEFEGGKGANQAVGIARLGHPVVFMGNVGNDSYGSRLRSALQTAGVQTELMETVEGPSGVALITHDRSGENCIVVVPGANGKVSSGYLERRRAHLADAAMILAQLEIPIETVEALAKLAQTLDIPFMLDPAPARPLTEALLRAVTWLTPNESEASVLTGLSIDNAEPQEIAQRLLTMGPRNVALKLGARGAFLAGEDIPPMLIPARRVKVVDTTAAGDAFNAAFAVRLARGDHPVEAAAYANAAAGLSVMVKGAQPSMASAEQVEKFMQVAEFSPAAHEFFAKDE